METCAAAAPIARAKGGLAAFQYDARVLRVGMRSRLIPFVDLGDYNTADTARDDSCEHVDPQTHRW